jgi:alkyl hydroperoxide reductase subunit F
MYKLAIIGGGPAGVAAGIYAARKKIKTVLITDFFGGQSLVSEDVRNWIGEISIPGEKLAKNMEAHLRAQEDIDIKTGMLVSSIEKNGENFSLMLTDGETIEAKYLLTTVGSKRRKLSIPGDDKFEGKGVVYCSTCDAPLFKNKTVAVVGGGNAGLESAIDLTHYATKIYLLVRSGALKGDPISQDKVTKSEKIEILYNAEPKEILGDAFVNGIKYLDKMANEIKELKLDGVFVEIGSIPNSNLVEKFVKLNDRGEVIADPKTQKAGENIWAAGDVTDVLYKQNNVSMGDAIKAVLNIYETIHKS